MGLVTRGYQRSHLAFAWRRRAIRCPTRIPGNGALLVFPVALCRDVVVIADLHYQRPFLAEYFTSSHHDSYTKISPCWVTTGLSRCFQIVYWGLLYPSVDLCIDFTVLVSAETLVACLPAVSTTT